MHDGDFGLRRKVFTFKYLQLGRRAFFDSLEESLGKNCANYNRDNCKMAGRPDPRYEECLISGDRYLYGPLSVGESIDVFARKNTSKIGFVVVNLPFVEAKLSEPKKRGE